MHKASCGLFDTLARFNVPYTPSPLQPHPHDMAQLSEDDGRAGRNVPDILSPRIGSLSTTAILPLLQTAANFSEMVEPSRIR